MLVPFEDIPDNYSQNFWLADHLNRGIGNIQLAECSYRFDEINTQLLGLYRIDDHVILTGTYSNI